jgi:ATP-dependent DNA helicase RecQ
MAALGVPLTGRIPPGEQAGAGRAVARLTDLGWGEALRELFSADTPDGEVPVPLRHALATVLQEWDPADPPTGVVGIDSASRPQLARHLADGLARYLRLPVLARLEPTGAGTDRAEAPGAGADADAESVATVHPAVHPVADAGSTNGAHRLAVVAGRLRLSDQDAVSGHRVLLVDDRSGTGWTLAVAARQLRRAGASAVHPIVLATT